ncbi:MAG: sodium ion-translocating decarboxylase subunit beta [Chloroflexota bacterium]|nr:sodium ion-translocating decarboxylase subunit beta [Chloroflexota bacterium]
MAEFIDFFESTGLANIMWQQGLMILVGLGFIFLAVARNMEPYELLPIGLGIVAVNMPLTGLTTLPTEATGVQEAGLFGITFHYGLAFWNILPPLMFLGLGASTDFGPMIANPKTLLLGAAAQIGIFAAFWGALATGLFEIPEAASIGIIGGADGPTTIFISAKLAPEILGITAVIAYSYVATVAFVQPPIMKLFTTKAEREIEMKPLRDVSRREKLIIPTFILIVVILVVPRSAPLIAMFMIGNLLKESGVVPRLVQASTDVILYVSTIFLMLTIGAQLVAERVFDLETLAILGLGLVAFCAGTASGVIFAKIMNLFLKEKINPLIGSAGVSAVPMAARTSHHLGQEANPKNFLLYHAMGPNAAGVIGSAAVAGVFLALIQ